MKKIKKYIYLLYDEYFRTLRHGLVFFRKVFISLHSSKNYNCHWTCSFNLYELKYNNIVLLLMSHISEDVTQTRNRKYSE